MQIIDDFKTAYRYFRDKTERHAHSRRNKKRETACAHCATFSPDEEHVIFITAPPGYGSILPCSVATAGYGVPMLPETALARRRHETAAPLR